MSTENAIKPPLRSLRYLCVLGEKSNKTKINHIGVKMNRFNKIAILFIATTILFTGCATITTRTLAEEAKIAYMRDTGVFHIPVVAELEVSQTKITGTASGGVGENFELLRVRAVNNALAANNADVLLEPRFSYESSTRGMTVKVTGFPANYKNFRTITERDTQLINNTYHLLKSNVYIPK